MKNKISYLVFGFIINFYCVHPAYCRPMIDEEYRSELYTETPSSELECDVCEAYRYVSLGVGPIIFVPNIGLGYRERYSHFGWDTALSVSTIGYAHQLSAYLAGHYYLSSLEKKSVYLGLGLMGSGIFTNHGDGCRTLSPDFIVGQEFGNKRFLEMHVAVPTIWMNSKEIDSLYFPLLYIKYGISF